MMGREGSLLGDMVAVVYAKRNVLGLLMVSDDPLRGVECVVDAETYRSLNIAVFREDEVLKKSRESGRK